MSKTVLVTFGTRPEAIKMVPVVHKLREDGNFQVKICVTGQHRQMLDQVMNFFQLASDFNLCVMRENQNLYDLTAEIMRGMRSVIEAASPDIVLVQGDTTTTFTASLAAFYSKKRVCHVEAGLRTGEKYNPFPEEMNRVLVSHLSDLHFAPTEQARQNLLKEGVFDETIIITGNTAIDTLLATQKKINSGIPYSNPLSGLKLTEKVILVTAHRRESFGEGFENICMALAKLVRRNSNITVVYPVHLNPNVREPVIRILGKHNRIHLIEPLDYVSFVALMDRAYMVLTDSGGIQEEAPSLGKPVLVMRKFTERMEGVVAGTAKLIGIEKEEIVKRTEALLHNKNEYEGMARSVNPYGDGRAADRIVKALSRFS